MISTEIRRKAGRAWHGMAQGMSILLVICIARCWTSDSKNEKRNRLLIRISVLVLLKISLYF